jgi:hypothetical protein
MLGGTRCRDIALPGGEQREIADPTGQVAPEDPTAESQRLVFGELASVADLIESFAVCLREAARRDDRVRVHGYVCDLARCIADARGAYGRIADLAKLGARQ